MDMVSYKRKEGSKVKYIRTKDGFYGHIWKDCNIEKNSKELWEGFFIKNNYIYEKLKHWEYDEKYRIEYRKIDKIVKSADTIEELCDEVCCDNKVQLLVNYYTNETKAQMIKNTIEELFYKGKKEVYGAIWTEKGLIYVAKMNSKGELELL